MTNKSGNIGTWTETQIVNHLRAHGFEGADEMTAAQRLRLKGAEDQGDIGVCPGVMCESKGGHSAEVASDAVIIGWLEETELERVHRRADVAFLCWKRKGKGGPNAGQWWAAMPGWTYYYLVKLALGYSAQDADANYHAHDVGDLAPPVRMTLADVEHLLRIAGYGTPLEGI